MSEAPRRRTLFSIDGFVQSANVMPQNRRCSLLSDFRLEAFYRAGELGMKAFYRRFFFCRSATVTGGYCVGIQIPRNRLFGIQIPQNLLDRLFSLSGHIILQGHS